MSDRKSGALTLIAVLALSGCATPDTATPTAAQRTASSSAEPLSPTPASVGAKPARLLIPSLDLDEQLIGLGLADDRTLEVPQDAGDVGWYVGGGRPGGPGPTVLAGHVDSKTGPAVFFRLTELRPGDVVLIDDVDGNRTTYVVDRVEDHPKNDFPTGDVFGATPDDQLRLITCTGVYDRAVGSHRDNRIVFASPVD